MSENNNTGNLQGNMRQMTEEERQRELARLKNSWIMYERTLKEAKERRSKKNKDGIIPYQPEETKKTLSLIENMQNDIRKQYLRIGGNESDLLNLNTTVSKKKNKERNELLRKILEQEKQSTNENAQFKMLSDDEVKQIEQENDLSFFSDNNPKEVETPVSEPVEEAEQKNENAENRDTFNIGMSSKAINNTIKYDTIPLPSKGQCYKSKISKIPVAYLTAYDENMIVAPNMYRDGTFLDHILKNKIMTDEISPNDLLPGDRDAIILWLRASGYGTEFPIKVTDPTTRSDFDTVIDLSTLKYKKFDIKGDSNGHFSFELPVTHDKVKFKFLTYGDLQELNKMEEEESVSLKKNKVESILNELDKIINSDNNIETADKLKLTEALKTIQKYKDNIQTDTDMEFTHGVTNRMLKSIVSINGITNRDYIDEYVTYMNVKDASALRKYIVDNEPGVDFDIEVERPESLGGGSVTTFLSIDQFIFLNIA